MPHKWPPAAWGQPRLKNQKQIKWLWFKLLSFRVICYMAIKKLNRNYFCSIHSAYLPLHNKPFSGNSTIVYLVMIPDLGRARNRQLNWVWRIHFKEGSLIRWQVGAGCWLENWLVRGLPHPPPIVFSPCPGRASHSGRAGSKGKNPKSEHSGRTSPPVQTLTKLLLISHDQVQNQCGPWECEYWRGVIHCTHQTNPNPGCIQLEKSIKLCI